VTVRNHIQHLISKLGLHSQIEAVAYAYRNNLVAVAPQFAGEGAR
jgi:DNA-binding NarL/FixJ family response regulator